MRHLKRGRKLNRTSSHRKALLRNLAANLIYEERIITTPEKAKEARPFVERLITLAKRGGLANYRLAISRLKDEEAAHKLFHEIATRYQ
ncbi:MAG: 50S ribosomal protein L17, partial [Planctomycetes bacterium DG_23]